MAEEIVFLLLRCKRERVAERRAVGGERGTKGPGGESVGGRDGRGETKTQRARD